jgi:hypothetical protein
MRKKRRKKRRRSRDKTKRGRIHHPARETDHSTPLPLVCNTFGAVKNKGKKEYR